MSLIPDCLYPTPFDQDRQYRKTRTSLIPVEGRGPFLLSLPYPDRLEEDLSTARN
jgi:hypothetical protein